MAMAEITKEAFKKYFMKYGKQNEGWGPGYWDRFYEKEEAKWAFDGPPTPERNRMFIVTDFGPKPPVHRMVFMSEEGEEEFFR
jgi:hypothetical protein